MDKEDMVGTPEKDLKNHLFQFESQIKNALMGLDYKTAIVVIDKLLHKLDVVVMDTEHDIYFAKSSQKK